MIFYGTQNGYICVISCKDYSVTRNYKLHSDCVSYLLVHNNMLYIVVMIRQYAFGQLRTSV